MTTQPKLTRRQFLTTLAAAAAGALVSGVVKVEAEPVAEVDVVPLGPQYLLKDDFDDMAWTEPATAWYLTVDGTQATPGPGVRTVMDWDAREDVRGMTMDAGILSTDWNDPWIDYGRLSFYVTEDRIVVKDGGMLTMRWLQGVEYVDAYLPLANQLLFVIVGSEYTEHLVYAGGRFRVWQRFVPAPASGLYPDWTAHVSFMCDPSRVRIDEPLAGWERDA